MASHRPGVEDARLRQYLTWARRSSSPVTPSSGRSKPPARPRKAVGGGRGSIREGARVCTVNGGTVRTRGASKRAADNGAAALPDGKKTRVAVGVDGRKPLGVRPGRHRTTRTACA
jgi:hypothetical protein